MNIQHRVQTRERSKQDTSRERKLLSKRSISGASELIFSGTVVSGIFRGPALLATRLEDLSTSRLSQLLNKPDYDLSTETTGSTRQLHASNNYHAGMFLHNRPLLFSLQRKLWRHAYPSTSRVNATRYHARSTRQPAQRITATKRLLDGNFLSLIPINWNVYWSKRTEYY